MTLADELALIPGRVRTGCARLDMVYGHAWVWKVDLQRLNMFTTADDIGGQLYGTCENALAALGFKDRGFTHGMSIENPDAQYSTAGITICFEALTTAWFKRIVDLRAQRLHLQ